MWLLTVMFLTCLGLFAKPAGPKGQFVRVELKGAKKTLSVAELQVFSGGANVALKKEAKQNATGAGGVASRGVDGNTDGNWGGKSVTHTPGNKRDPWWEVDLGQEYAVDKIVIWNRTGGRIGDRLNGCVISLLATDRKPVWTVTCPKPGDKREFTVGPPPNPLETGIKNMIALHGAKYAAGPSHLKRFLVLEPGLNSAEGKSAYNKLKTEVEATGAAFAEAIFTEALKPPVDIPFPTDAVDWYQNDMATAWPCPYSESDKNWRKIRWFIRCSWKKGLKRGPNQVTLCANFHMPAAKIQGMNISAGGGQKQKIICNGKEIPAKGGTRIYRLPLKKGENSLYLRAEADVKPPPKPKPGAKKKKKRGPSFSYFLTPVELEHVYPEPKHKLAALWRSVEYLAKNHANYPGAQYKKEIKALFAQLGSPDMDKAVHALQYKALVLDNPVVDFDKILVRRGKAFRVANWQGNSEKRPFGYNNEIASLNLRDGSLETVYRSPNNGSTAVCDLVLSFNARKLMFSSANEKEKNWQVFEMNIDGSGVRQVTRSPGADVDNYNGIYVPNGKIIFISTANMTGVPCVGGKNKVGTLYTADMDGSNVRQLTFEQDADWYPWVMADGKVMYLRWEYTDNSHYFTRILMTMMPDGSRQRSFYGSGSYWPNTMFHARNIPGSNSQFAAICSGHHGVSRVGELILFDVNKGEKNTQGAIQKIPGYNRNVQNIIRDKYGVGVVPYFDHPFPLSDTYFLAEGHVPGIGTGLFLLDRFDSMVLIKEGRDLFEPIPLRPRKRPQDLASHINPKANDALISVQNIYEGPGLAGIPRGTVKTLRLFTYSYGYRDNGGHHQLAIEGGWDCKRLLGTAPVETDGSVTVRVPHSTPISIQPLDENGQSLQYFRSWLVAMPGESLSCVGCHEPSRTAPIPRTTQAMAIPPRKLTPWNEHKLHGFGFIREVQPVLDRRCAGCHDGSKPERPNFKSTEEERGFAVSYHSLHKFVRRPGPESDFEILDAMEYHSSTSELVQILKKGHHGVELMPDDWKRLYTWIDLNVPYHATWTDCRGPKRINAIASRARELRKLYASVDDDPEYVPPNPGKKQEYRRPAGSPKPKAPAPELAGWPFDANQAKAKQGNSAVTMIDLGDGRQLKLRRIPTGSFVMGSNNGAEDERPMAKVTVAKPFWMAESEITNGQYALFDPKHDSRFIDQQWKDHIYQGYAANKPHMPVIRVTWQRAMAFCEWLSKKTGKKVTLPTEAQWEYACRAGSGRDFWFEGSDYGPYANMADKNIGLLAVAGVDPMPIPEKRRTLLNDFVPRDSDVDDGRLLADSTRQYKPNPWGLYDMHGNVCEWTRTDYEPYPYKTATTKSAGKVARGGSWRDRRKRSTASYRFAYQPYQKVFNVGFRVIVEE